MARRREMDRKNNPGCLGFLFPNRRVQRRESLVDETEELQGEVSFPYRVTKRIMSPAEQSFYHVIQKVLGDAYMICPQVSLSAVFWISDHTAYTSAFNRIARKRVDFIVCDALTTKTLFGIELDDSSHKREDRAERDEFIDNVFNAAGLPLVHFAAKEAYNTADLKRVFDRVLTVREVDASPFLPEVGVRPVQEPAIPRHEICPNCGSPFRIRESISGPNQGRKFNVCSRYPECNTKILVEN